jgi:hypothetical protein
LLPFSPRGKNFFAPRSRYDDPRNLARTKTKTATLVLTATREFMIATWRMNRQGARATARSGHARIEFSQAGAKPWAWHAARVRAIGGGLFAARNRRQITGRRQPPSAVQPPPAGR